MIKLLISTILNSISIIRNLKKKWINHNIHIIGKINIFFFFIEYNLKKKIDFYKFRFNNKINYFKVYLNTNFLFRYAKSIFYRLNKYTHPLGFNKRNLSKKKNILYSNSNHLLNDIKVIIICKRTTQNVFITLTNWKGDTLTHYSVGETLSYHSKWLEQLKRKRYKSRKDMNLYLKQKDILNKKKSKAKTKIYYRTLENVVNKFCDKAIIKLGILKRKGRWLFPEHEHIMFFDIIFIRFESNFKHIFKWINKRFRMVPKKIFHQISNYNNYDENYRVKYQYRSNYDSFLVMVRKVQKYLSKFFSFISFIQKNKFKYKIKWKVYFMKIKKLLLESYLNVKYIKEKYFKEVYYFQPHKINVYKRFYILNSIKLKQTYLFY